MVFSKFEVALFTVRVYMYGVKHNSISNANELHV